MIYRALLLLVSLTAPLCAAGCGFDEAEKINQTEVIDQLNDLKAGLEKQIELTAILAAHADQQQAINYAMLDQIRELRRKIAGDQRLMEQWKRYYDAEQERIRRAAAAASAAGSAGDGR